MKIKQRDLYLLRFIFKKRRKKEFNDYFIRFVINLFICFHDNINIKYKTYKMR